MVVGTMSTEAIPVVEPAMVAAMVGVIEPTAVFLFSKVTSTTVVPSGTL